MRNVIALKVQNLMVVPVVSRKHHYAAPADTTQSSFKSPGRFFYSGIALACLISMVMFIGLAVGGIPRSLYAVFAVRLPPVNVVGSLMICFAVKWLSPRIEHQPAGSSIGCLLLSVFFSTIIGVSSTSAAFFHASFTDAQRIEAAKDLAWMTLLYAWLFALAYISIFALISVASVNRWRWSSGHPR